MVALPLKDPESAAIAMSIWKLDQRYAQQNRNELGILLKNHVVGAKRILEIGSCFGRTLEAMAEVAAPGALLRVIDLGKLPEESVYCGFDVQPSLTRMAQRLMSYGCDVVVAIGSSQNPQIVDWARQWAPYDFILIDAGHTEEAVAADWHNYGGMGKVVAFHDIANPELGVKKFWDKLITNMVHLRDYREIVCPMGIGVVHGGAQGASTPPLTGETNES
jgi:predicted O-methyltransferase YrrM